MRVEVLFLFPWAECLGCHLSCSWYTWVLTIYQHHGLGYLLSSLTHFWPSHLFFVLPEGFKRRLRAWVRDLMWGLHWRQVLLLSRALIMVFGPRVLKCTVSFSNWAPVEGTCAGPSWKHALCLGSAITCSSQLDFRRPQGTDFESGCLWMVTSNQQAVYFVTPFFFWDLCCLPAGIFLI